MPSEPLTSHVSLSGRAVLVTGATGFIGARLVEKLVGEAGAKVTAAVRSPARAGRLVDAGARIEKVNLKNRSEVDKIVSGHDTVFHLAHDFKQSVGYNLALFESLAEACAAHGVRRLVYVSSIAVYDDWPEKDLIEASPASGKGGDYKNAKMAIERTLRRRVREGTLDAVIIQPTIVYGPHGWMWTDRIVEQLTSGTVVLPDQGQGLCNAVYVDDVADALITASTAPGQAGEAFIVSGPAPVTWRAFFEAYAGALNVDAIDYVDAALLAKDEQNTAGGLKALIGNPLRFANWWPVQRALAILRSMGGDKIIDAMRAAAVGLRGRGGPVTYYPSAGDLALYRSTGRCSIEKARIRLGYEPKVDFPSGARLTADYIKSKFPTAS